MSLNKFSESSIKPYLNVGVNEVKCNSLTVNGIPYNPSIPPTISSGVYTPSVFNLSGVTFINPTVKHFTYIYINGICTINAQINIEVGNLGIGTGCMLYCSIPSGMNIVNTQNPNNGQLNCETSNQPIYLPTSFSEIAPGGTNVLQTFFQSTNTSVAGISGKINISLNISFAATM